MIEAYNKQNAWIDVGLHVAFFASVHAAPGWTHMDLWMEITRIDVHHPTRDLAAYREIEYSRR